MKSLVRASITLLSLAFLAGCASTKAEVQKPAINKVCVVSGEPLDGSGPTVFLNSDTIGFCCDKCVAKFAAMDPVAKQAAVDKVTK